MVVKTPQYFSHLRDVFLARNLLRLLGNLNTVINVFF